MRLQLISGLVLVAALSAPADADGTLTARGVYYKERATRVMQPMLDGMFDAGMRGVVTGHFLVDAITSASSSSGADDAKPFTEKRYEGGIGYTHEVEEFRLGADGKYSTESDYKSIYVGLRAEADLAQKNTTLGLGLGLSKDTINAGAAQGLSVPTLECEPGEAKTECKLTAYSLFASGSQILGKNLVAGLTYDVSKANGYQSNPYRMALADDGVAPERHPTTRTRAAFAGSIRYFIPVTQTTLIGAYRYYRDNWEVHAHTPEIRIVQQVGYSADASFRYRFYKQDQAYFYRDRYVSIDPSVSKYLSDDVKLDDFTTHTFEAKLGIFGEAFGIGGRWSAARFEGILSYVAQDNRFGNAIIAHVALTVPFAY
ncbi:MAG: DUF3570 domain-containing protein [Polyangiales bacterium]